MANGSDAVDIGISAQMKTNSSDQIIYLHGDLDLKINEARCLPNMDMLSERLRRCFTACDTCQVSSANGNRKQRHAHGKIITSDPYVTVLMAGATVARTRVLPNSQNPVWEEEFHVPLAHKVAHVEFQVKDNDVFGAQVIGTVLVPARRIVSGESIDEWFPVIGSYGKPPKPDSALHLVMRFTPVESNPLFQHGIAADPQHLGVRNTYFPVRKGCSLTLYQDAHVREGDLPPIELEKGANFEHEKCWEDICHAILEAHHLIYIVGWSVYHKVKLVREPSSGRPLPGGGDLNLGELLKYKSQEGVRVLLLVWDDKTSHNKFFINTAGVMQTHDEETRKFFKHSSVICVLSPRYASSKLSIVKQQVVGTLFTHHQKCVLVDTQASGNNRKITAFLGGLDLCDGRYDTPEHRLFRDLDTVFQDDFHNPTLPAGSKCPRQPWHDLHCRIEGPAAYDVLTNFEQRWRKATKWSEFGQRFRRISRWHDDALIKIERISWILSPSQSVSFDDPILSVSRERHPETWHVQVFRSIDSGSVKGFAKTVQEAEAQNLVCAKNLVIDKSIQTGYIQAIRSAQHFIYIENQYFLGSAYGWPSYENAGANNLIPMELALKIASKIRAKERFAVYIVIPMWPEGIPTTSSVQEILFWQSQTMQMMYEIIAQELKSMQLGDSHPQDYLNFYCLGNREELPDGMSQPTSQPSTNGDTVPASQKNRRFMIYVHAKGMIVDDEYVILGSANINERSLSGSRDTEIAMGAYQPHHTWAEKKKHPHGQIYGYRMSLWAEHMKMVDNRFKEPQSLDCVSYVNKLAQENWETFVAEELRPLRGHLLKYPLLVEANGKVGSLPGHENFPDVGGKILGCPTSLPDALTT
ncbi:phospholipase D delta [Macadamia integrifolia]|uniref:phospholipase D delta n=1 Tax=Macadamia integrifolia TaxID=60698 RepID=UPI001C4E4957|nr:phospholipase D delta [Macadamia integrifolia]XP_042508029.1 phospholipase D delta [Macadamia integrifolia]